MAEILLIRHKTLYNQPLIFKINELIRLLNYTFKQILIFMNISLMMRKASGDAYVSV